MLSNVVRLSAKTDLKVSSMLTPSLGPSLSLGSPKALFAYPTDPPRPDTPDSVYAAFDFPAAVMPPVRG